ncbi:site-specific DNA-methyltransferase [Pseudomonas putida]|uniref:site-specific DNA-methyltransferase n=1 Tax=Pseudomonas putida TaxID=303 RepID=UPI0008593AF0|nr:site-specific DNA-methyltransferase [Pseudomonas putida]
MPTLEFKGKQFIYSHHLGVPFRELQVVPEKSLPAAGNEPSLDDNLIIQGDNLEALKALLPTHAGKVDCIFIDPPYNTGEEKWCYNDNVRSPLMKEWLKKSADPVDKEDLERHDKWLCMMWPRISLLKELMSSRGSIWVTLDDHEPHRLRMLMDEVIGADKFVANIVWQHAVQGKGYSDIFSVHHNHIIVYGNEDFSFEGLDRTEEDNVNYANPDNDPNGAWRLGDVRNALYRPKLKYPLKTPSGKYIDSPENGWRWKKETFEKKIASGEALFVDDETRVIRKIYLKNQDKRAPETIWFASEVGSTRHANTTLKNIFGGTSPFPTPKPVELVSRILKLAAYEDSIVLDSFAGSGTTAHAVLEANKADDGNRRFVLVECENYADEITAERVRRVVKGYSYTGTQREELHRESISWSVFGNEKKHKKVMERINSIEKRHCDKYDKITKKIKDDVLTVTGERAIKETAPGLGGSFTYCTLGEVIDVESLLTGEGMPSFEALARYVFYTATGQSLDRVGKPTADGLVGETELFRIHLLYKPDTSWLRSNDAALNADRVATIEAGNKHGKRAIVFAVAKFMSQKELTTRRIEFCQLPYAVHRILGD